jgi:ABC-type sugar transport system ATPase subunit
MQPVLELRGIEKSFGGTRALHAAGMTVTAGAVVGLIGANGAGKSTLVNVASGRLQPDAGEIIFKQDRMNFRDPRDALRVGIASVPQEITSLDNLTVADGIVLGAEPGRRTPSYSQRLRARHAERALARLGVEIDPDSLIRDLGPSEQRLVSFAAILHRRAELVFLDEPTAAMGVDDAQRVLSTIRTLSGEGVAIVLITHRFSEILAVCDQVLAMREGQTLWARPRSELSVDDLVEAIASDTEAGGRPEISGAVGPVVLEARAVSGDNFEDASFELHQGEVLGFTGLVGCGVNELLEAVGGERRLTAGQLLVNGEPLRLRSPAHALQHGIGQLVPERSRSGFLGLTVRSNASLSAIGQIGRFGLVTRRQEWKHITTQMKSLGLQNRMEEPLAALSGGNRQKVLLSRNVLAGAKVMVLGDPTAGVDVAARASIHQQLRALAQEGTSVIVSASEPEELLGVADRVIIMANGTTIGEYRNDELDTIRLTRLVATAGSRDDAGADVRPPAPGAAESS